MNAAKSNYSEKLKDPRWQKRRLEIMNRDDFTCRKCGDKTKTLNVHHLSYIKGRDPWDYRDDILVTLCEDCHKAEHDGMLRIKIYLAGKVSKNCWRHTLIRQLRAAAYGSCGDNHYEFPGEIMDAIGIHTYTGPFFVSCDHGCFHGDASHGAVAGNWDDDVPTREPLQSQERFSVALRALDGIERCDLFFAWVDTNDCFGTLVEIGYAAGIGKEVIIGMPLDFEAREHWFSANICAKLIRANSPAEALEPAIKYAQGFRSAIP